MDEASNMKQLINTLRASGKNNAGLCVETVKRTDTKEGVGKIIIFQGGNGDRWGLGVIKRFRPIYFLRSNRKSLILPKGSNVCRRRKNMDYSITEGHIITSVMRLDVKEG